MPFSTTIKYSVFSLLTFGFATNAVAQTNTNSSYDEIYESLKTKQAGALNNQKSTLEQAIQSGALSQAQCQSANTLLSQGDADITRSIINAYGNGKHLKSSSGYSGRYGSTSQIAISQCVIGKTNAKALCLQDYSNTALSSDADYMYHKAIYAQESGQCRGPMTPTGGSVIAENYMKKAAELGYPKAQVHLGKSYFSRAQYWQQRNESNPSQRSTYGPNEIEGLKKKAFVLYGEAADQGDVSAINRLKADYNYDHPNASQPVKPVANVSLPATPPVGSVATISLPSTIDYPPPLVSTTASASSYMAKTLWVASSNADIFDENNLTIGSANFAASVTVYGERDEMGKIDLSEEKWVRMSDLSESKPEMTDKISRSSSAPINKVREHILHVPSNDSADYFLLDKTRNNQGLLEVVTKRSGPSGISLSKREINCKAGTFRYLGDGDTIAEMNAPYASEDMRKAVKGDVYTKISYDIMQEVCTQSPSPQSVSLKRAAPDVVLYNRYVNVQNLNVRDSQHGNKVGSQAFGSRVQVYEVDNGWSRIAPSGVGEKWVSSKFLVQSKPVAKKAAPATTKRRSGSNEVGDGGRYGVSRSLKQLKSKCSYRQMAQHLVGEFDSGGCRYVKTILTKERDHPYVTNLTNYMNSSNWP